MSMSERSPRYLIGPLHDGRWGLFDHASSVLRPVQTYPDRASAQDALMALPEQFIVWHDEDEAPERA